MCFQDSGFDPIIPSREYFQGDRIVIFSVKCHKNCRKPTAACPVLTLQHSSKMDQQVQFYAPLNKVLPAVLYANWEEKKQPWKWALSPQRRKGRREGEGANKNHSSAGPCAWLA